MNPNNQVRISSPTRLHLSLIDMNATYTGRVDGGAGIAISSPRAEMIGCATSNNLITVLGDADVVSAEMHDSLVLALEAVRNCYQFGGIELSVLDLPHEHVGLGSKTQALLGAGMTYCRLYDHSPEVRGLASIVGRGGTSGIGVEAFNSGGFIVDCGYPFSAARKSFLPAASSTWLSPAPLVGRYDFPDWPILLVTPVAKQIDGTEEEQLFTQACPIPLTDAQACAQIVLMMLIPAVIECDLGTFCKGLNLLQGLAWKRAEIDIQSPVVAEVMTVLERLGLQGVGMTSIGSTVFALGPILDDAESLEHIVSAVQRIMDSHQGGTCALTRADNHGAQIEVMSAN